MSLGADRVCRPLFNPSLGYKVYRNDRKSDALGGVLTVIKSEFELVDVNASSTIELISGVVKLSFHGTRR